MNNFSQHYLPASAGQALQREFSLIPANLDNIPEETQAQLGKAAKPHWPKEILQSLGQLKQPRGLPFLVIHNLPLE